MTQQADGGPAFFINEATFSDTAVIEEEGSNGN
jgi:hypothetical protein